MNKMKNILIASVALILFSQVLQAQVYKPEFVRYQLNNGLNVILHRDMSSASVSVNMAYIAGSSLDPKGKRGLANLCGGLDVLGSKNVSYRDLLRIQFFAAAKISAAVDTDLMTISSSFPANYLDAALWVEADRMKYPCNKVTKKQLKNSIVNVVKQRRVAGNKALGDVNEKIYEELYPKGHPYQHLNYGDTSDIKSITLSDVKRFAGKFYVPANASLTIAGNFDIDDARALIEKHFSSIKAGSRHKWNALPPIPAIGQVNIIKEDNIAYSRMYLIIPTVARNHPDAVALDFFAKLLSGTMNARLQQSLVANNPYIYSVEAIQSSRRLEGDFWIVITCKPEARMMEIYGLVEKSLSDMRKAQIVGSELMEARNQVLMLYSRGVEDIFGHGGRANMLNTNTLLSDDPLFLTSTVEKQYMLPAAELEQVINKYFSMDNVLVMSVVQDGKKEYGVVFE
jgi:zinc protease